MIFPFKIKIPIPITIKLILFAFPLMCIPIAIVGYVSYKASVESVTRLSRNEQMLQAKAAATEINTIFQSCCMDLETLARFILEDIQCRAMLPPEADREGGREKISKLFKDFRSRSPYYIQIRLLDALGEEVIRPRLEGLDNHIMRQRTDGSFWGPSGKGEQSCDISRVNYSEIYQGFVVQFSKTLRTGDAGLAGKIIIDLDFGKVIELVNSIRIGEEGSAFLVDQSGRIIAHPVLKPYEFDLRQYDDPHFRKFVVDMITGETGWRTYFYLGEKTAAFAPVPATGWSLAVSIPIEEFKREAKAVRAKVFQLVMAMLIFGGLGVGVLSYQLLKPVRNLVVATKRMAGGDLWQEIPVRSRDELGTLTRSFNRMVRNLREIQTELIRSEKLISMGRLSAGVAHEVRNPLNAIKGAIVYLQKRKPKDALIQEYTQLILEEINRLNAFVTEFLYFAKQAPPNPMPTDFNKLLKNAINLLDEMFKTNGIKISLHLEPLLPILEIDPDQIKQVFLNLFVNAVQAMPDGGILTVSTAIKGDRKSRIGARVVAEVKDDGTGIAQDDLKNIFDPFFSTKESGTGLGLPIILGIVEGHGGKIMALSHEGEGTTVILELPFEGRYLDREMRDEKEDSDR